MEYIQRHIYDGYLSSQFSSELNVKTDSLKNWEPGKQELARWSWPELVSYRGQQASSAWGTWSLLITPQHYDLADKDETQEDYGMEVKVCKLTRKDVEEIWSNSGILEMLLISLWETYWKCHPFLGEFQN